MFLFAVSVSVILLAGAAAIVFRKRRRSRPSGDSALWQWAERTNFVFGSLGGVAAIVSLLLQVKSPPPAAPVAGQTASAAATGQSVVPQVLVARDEQPLTPSSWLDDNDRDKVDLDTGEPGYGRASVQVGPARGGGLAEIIVEEDRIHGPDQAPRYVRGPAPASYDGCEQALADEAGRTAEILIEDLTPGTVFCVLTSERNVAHVRVVDRGAGRLVVAFTTWEA